MWHVLIGIEGVVYEIDPHETKVVKQVNWNFGLGTREQITEVIWTQFILKGVVARERNIVEITNCGVVLGVPIQSLINLKVRRSFQCLATSTQSVSGAVRWRRSLTKRIKSTNTDSKWCLHEIKEGVCIAFTISELGSFFLLFKSLLLAQQFSFMALGLSEMLWGNTFQLITLLASVGNIRDKRGSSCFVRFEVVHNLEQVAEFLVETDGVVLVAGRDHGFGGTLDLEGVTEQVEDEWKVKIGQIYKVVLFFPEIGLEIPLELPTVEPGVVNRSGNLLGGVEEGVWPTVALNHLHIEIVEGVHGEGRVVEALLTEGVLVELETNVEGLNIVVGGWFGVEDLIVDVFLELLEFGGETCFFEGVGIGVVGAILGDGLVEVGSSNVGGDDCCLSEHNRKG